MQAQAIRAARRVLTALLLAGSLALPARPEPAAAAGEEFHVPVEYYKLPNGLRVVLSPDHTAPTVCVGVYYRIGFRIEPKDRTGFAHLFEHMMFQGSQNLGKMEFIKLVQQNGGILNGSTRFDFTNYFEVMPSNKLQTVLWAEADRMNGLTVTEANLKNQQGVVGNEVKVNVLNAPYGGFPWIDMPMAANSNWYNAHNFYGDLTDIEAAKLDEVQKFFQTYYAPNNAVLTIVGDFDPAEAKKMVERYFGPIKAASRAAGFDRTEAGKREARGQEGSARSAPGRGRRLPHAGSQHSRILRHGIARAAAHRRRRQPPARRTRAKARLDRLGGRRHQPPWQHVQLQRADAADGEPDV